MILSTHGENVCLLKGLYKNVHVSMSLYLLNKWGKRDKILGLASILSLFPLSLMYSIIQGHECYILFIT